MAIQIIHESVDKYYHKFIFQVLFEKVKTAIIVTVQQI